MRRLAILAVIGTCSLAVASGEIQDFNGKTVDIEYWSGSGTNEAVCVVDFGLGLSYGFGYRWDGERTGFDMLNAIAAGGSFSFTYLDFASPFVDTLTYAGRTMGANGWPNDWTAYFVAGNGDDWQASLVGAADRVLRDGDWDGWVSAFNDAYPPELPPRTPPYTVSVLFGLEAGLAGVARVETVVAGARIAPMQRWVEDAPPRRRLFAVLCHHGPLPDGTLPVLGVETIYFGAAPGVPFRIERNALQGVELVSTGAGKVYAVLDSTSAAHTASGLLKGTLTRDQIGSLAGPMLLVERDARRSAGPAPLLGAARYNWTLRRASMFRHGWEVMDLLSRFVK